MGRISIPLPDPNCAGNHPSPILRHLQLSRQESFSKPHWLIPTASTCYPLHHFWDRLNWEHSPWQDSELKGKHLAGAIRRLEKNLSPQTPKAYQQISYGRMQELIDRIFQIFRRFTPVFYFVGVDKQRLQDDLREPTSPIAAAYVILQLQAARLVEGVYNMGEGGMFIADEQNQHERLFRKGEVHALRDYVVGIAGHPPDMRGILDKPLWVNKGELEVDREILQLIDIAVYSVGNALVSGDWNQKWFQNLVPYIASNWNGDEVWDGGIIIFPPPASYPVL